MEGRTRRGDEVEGAIKKMHMNSHRNFLIYKRKLSTRLSDVINYKTLSLHPYLLFIIVYVLGYAYVSSVYVCV